MLRNETDYFVHPEMDDVIEVTWSPRSWMGLGIKHRGGYGSRDREEFSTSLKELLTNNWVKLDGIPQRKKETLV